MFEGICIMTCDQAGVRRGPYRTLYMYVINLANIYDSLQGHEKQLTGDS